MLTFKMKAIYNHNEMIAFGGESLKKIIKVISLTLTVALLSFTMGCNKTNETVSEAPSDNSTSQATDTEGKDETGVEEKFVVNPIYEAEYEDTYTKVKALTDAGNFTCMMLTDTHIDYVKKLAEGEDWYKGQPGEYYTERYLIEREIEHLIELANTSGVDCVVLGGDLIHGTSSYESSIADLEYFAKVFSEKCKVPVYVNRGNHDTNDYHRLVDNKCYVNNIITQEEWVDILVDPLSKNTAVHPEYDPKSTYYYVDFEEKKTRLIVLDSYNYPVISDAEGFAVWRAETWTGVEQEQLLWLAKIALDKSKDGWTYILSAHAPVVGAESFNGSDKVRRIIEAFNNRESVTVEGVLIDYSDVADINIPLSISGHTHIGSTRFFKSADHIAINTGSGKISYYPQRVYTDSETQINFHGKRYEGTPTEAKFDIVSISADDTVTRISFGFGIDEVYEKKDYSN